MDKHYLKTSFRILVFLLLIIFIFSCKKEDELPKDKFIGYWALDSAHFVIRQGNVFSEISYSAPIAYFDFLSNNSANFLNFFTSTPDTSEYIVTEDYLLINIEQDSFFDTLSYEFSNSKLFLTEEITIEIDGENFTYQPQKYYLHKSEKP